MSEEAKDVYVYGTHWNDDSTRCFGPFTWTEAKEAEKKLREIDDFTWDFITPLDPELGYGTPMERVEKFLVGYEDGEE